MNLTLAEAARLLGKSERQLRYSIANGTLKARKVGQRWSIRRKDLPLSPGQKRAAAQKETRALELELKASSSRKRLSIKEIRAYQVGVPLYHDLRSTVGEDHQAVARLEEALMLVACGYYEYDGREKSTFYSRAREQASRAAMTLMLEGEETRGKLLERFETLLLPAIGGLIRHSQRWGSRT